VTHSGLSKTQAEALGVFLLGPEMQARYAGDDTYDVAEGDEAAVRIPGATFRAPRPWVSRARCASGGDVAVAYLQRWTRSPQDLPEIAVCLLLPRMTGTC
jgi:hypothetical protein